MGVELIVGSAWIALNVGVALMAIIHAQRRERRLRLHSPGVVEVTEVYADDVPSSSRTAAAVFGNEPVDAATHGG